MHELSGTLFHRWYVTIFGFAFLFFAVRQLGWRKTFLYGVLAFGVGALAENGSVHLGFPYTTYSFNSALRGRELWIGDVPLFVPLSYTFMGYFAFAAGRLLASGPWRTRARYWWQEFLLAWMLAVRAHAPRGQRPGVARQHDRREPLQELVEQDARLEAGQAGAHAEVLAEADRHVRVRLTADVHGVGRRPEGLGVAVGRAVQHEHHLPRLDVLAAELDVGRRRAGEVHDGCDPAQHLLDR